MNKKKTLVISIAAGFLLVTCWLLAKSVLRQRQKESLATSIQAMPPFSFRTTGGNVFTNDSLIGGRPVVFVHFSPSCEHCQYEARELTANKDKLQGVAVLMVTGDTGKALADFETQYGLRAVPGLRVLTDTAGQLYNSFGFTGVPAFLIYDKHRQLSARINGEVQFDYLLRKIPVH